MSGMVKQSVLDDCKKQVESIYPAVTVDKVEHVGSRVPLPLPFLTPVALLRMDWRVENDGGWQFVEAVGEDIYE